MLRVCATGDSAVHYCILKRMNRHTLDTIVFKAKIVETSSRDSFRGLLSARGYIRNAHTMRDDIEPNDALRDDIGTLRVV